MQYLFVGGTNHGQVLYVDDAKNFVQKDVNDKRLHIAVKDFSTLCENVVLHETYYKEQFDIAGELLACFVLFGVQPQEKLQLFRKALQECLLFYPMKKKN